MDRLIIAAWRINFGYPVLTANTEGLRAPDCRATATYPSWGSDHFSRQHLRHFVPKLSRSLILIKLLGGRGISPKEGKA